MDYAAINRYFGKGLADALNEPWLVIGKTTWTKREVVTTLGVGNLIAARALTGTLHRLGITSVAQLARLDPASLYRVQGAGDIQVLVAMCVLEKHDFNIAAWWGWDTKGSTVQRHAKTSKRKRGGHALPKLANAS